MERLWNARQIWDPSEKDRPWEFAHPEHLKHPGRIELRLTNRWDERYAIPVRVSESGPEMETNFPLLAPETFPAPPRGWIVTADWSEHPARAQRDSRRASDCN